MQNKRGVSGFNVTSIWGMGTTFSIYPHQALVEQKMFVSFVCVCCLGFSFPSSCISFPQLQKDRQKSAIKENLAVAYPVYVNKEGLLKRKSLLQSQVPERFPKFWHFVFWEVCGGNDVEGQGVYFWWLGFVLSVWFSLMGEKGTFKGWLEGRSRLWGGVAIWQGEQVLQFSTFSFGKENCFP